MIENTKAYWLIHNHYGDRCAKRSGVPLMNHITEGIVILDYFGATPATKEAFCLHPLLQEDGDLKDNYSQVIFMLSNNPYAVSLAMEYRSVANEFLSPKVMNIKGRDIRLSPLYEVNLMLIADKVQNYKDFVTYHKGTHPRSKELDLYFNMWLDRLGIGFNQYQRICKLLTKT